MPTIETYNDHVVRRFLLAAAVWGIIGMGIGVYIAAQLAWPALNFDIPWLTFSRLRPNHTFCVIFALLIISLALSTTIRQPQRQVFNEAHA